MSVESAVDRYIEIGSKLNGGHFVMFDKMAQQAVAMDTQTLSQREILPASPELHAVCMEMVGLDGTVYDVDFFVKTQTRGREELENIEVHAVNGQARYNWIQNGAIWEQHWLQ
jgi:hypothetical protein